MQNCMHYPISRSRIPAQVRQSVCILFPVTAIEGCDDDVARLRFKAPHVDGDTVGIGSGNIERLDPARLAEQVPGDAGIERVRGELPFSLQQRESGLRNDQMQVARFPANGAVALRALDAFRRFNLENDGSAVALSRVNHRLSAPGNSQWPTRRHFSTGVSPAVRVRGLR